MLVDFTLRPLDDLILWTSENPTLSWFYMTDGSYWLNVGDQQLFQYTDAHHQTRDEWSAKWDADPEGHVTYYVARFLQDLLDVMPAVMEPVPPEIASWVATLDDQHQWTTTIERWFDQVPDPGDDDDDAPSWQVYDAAYDLRYQAVAWWGARKLDTGYLVNSPWLWIWQTTDRMVHIRWDNRDHNSGEVPFWTAETGEITMPLEAWIAEVDSFRERLQVAMANRVKQVAQGWRHSSVEVDSEALIEQQRWWDELLEKDRNAPPTVTDWQAVEAASLTIRGLQVGA